MADRNGELTTAFTRMPKPPWLRVKLPIGENYQKVRALVDQYQLHTICESGNCPNMGECWGAGTATFMILGNTCTRSCGFCAVRTGLPSELDQQEPERVALAIHRMGVRHAVITSVNRDELKDGGASIWVKTIYAVRSIAPGVTLETLIPDFKGNMDSVDAIGRAAPEVVSHNMETVPRLYRQVRPQAKYERSLAVLERLKTHNCRTKSGVMVGLGEQPAEVFQVMDDLRAVGCDVLTIGQYLQPTQNHLRVVEWIHPDQFKEYEQEALRKGFLHVESGPLVRSSYHAERHVR